MIAAGHFKEKAIQLLMIFRSKKMLSQVQAHEWAPEVTITMNECSENFRNQQSGRIKVKNPPNYGRFNGMALQRRAWREHAGNDVWVDEVKRLNKAVHSKTRCDLLVCPRYNSCTISATLVMSGSLGVWKIMQQHILTRKHRRLNSSNTTLLINEVMRYHTRIYTIKLYRVLETTISFQFRGNQNLMTKPLVQLALHFDISLKSIFRNIPKLQIIIQTMCCWKDSW